MLCNTPVLEKDNHYFKSIIYRSILPKRFVFFLDRHDRLIKTVNGNEKEIM